MALYSQLIPAAASQKTSSITIPAALSILGQETSSIGPKDTTTQELLDDTVVKVVGNPMAINDSTHEEGRPAPQAMIDKAIMKMSGNPTWEHYDNTSGRQAEVEAYTKNFNRYKFVYDLVPQSRSKYYRYQDEVLGGERHAKVLSNWKDALYLGEASSLQNMRHPHIAKAFAVGVTHDEMFIYIEDCGRLTLLQKLNESMGAKKPLTEEYMARVIKQVLQAVAHCHGEKVVVKNLKLGNVMLDGKTDEREVKLVDFSYSDIMKKGGELTEGVRDNDLFYAAPEAFEYSPKIEFVKASYTPGQHNFISVSYAYDIWAVGMMLYQMATSQSKVEGLNDEHHYFKDMSEKPFHAKTGFEKLSEDLQDLIRKMLTVNPESDLSCERRPTADECLQHKWFSLAPNDKVTEEEEKTILNNMKAFSKRGSLYAAMCNLAERELPCDTTDSAVRMFKNLQLLNSAEANGSRAYDHSSVLLLGAIYGYLLEVQRWSDSEARQLFNVVTVTDRNAITLYEFLAASRNWADDKYTVLFSLVFDKVSNYNEAEVLSPEDLFKFTKKGQFDERNLEAVQDDVVKLMKVIGTNKDGHITKEAFVKYMTA